MSLLVLEGGYEMGKWLVVVMILWVFVLGFGELSQTEVNILKYQLNMPPISGNAVGFRLLGSGLNGAFGMVWRVEKWGMLFTGQVMGFASDLFAGGGVRWERLYYDIYLLWRF